jgi:hypothetical protein
MVTMLTLGWTCMSIYACIVRRLNRDDIVHVPTPVRVQYVCFVRWLDWSWRQSHLRFFVPSSRTLFSRLAAALASFQNDNEIHDIYTR